MKKFKIAILGVCLALMLHSCGTNTGTDPLIGTGGGAVLGSIIGAVSGNTLVGTVIGSAVGAGVGSLIGNHMDKVKKELNEQLQNASVEEITDNNGLKAIKVTFDAAILFALDKAELNSTSMTELSNFSNVLKNNELCSVAIHGYTDSTGDDAINLPLSKERAEAVANYLEECGVRSSQIESVQGFGASNPVADNSTVEGRAQNRRVEVYIYASQAMIEAAQNGNL
ncbi:MAG: OmpA family protein [Prevotella sp.]|nr:OmpA family protein [Prevotella sp.]